MTGSQEVSGSSPLISTKMKKDFARSLFSLRDEQQNKVCSIIRKCCTAGEAEERHDSIMCYRKKVVPAPLDFARSLFSLDEQKPDYGAVHQAT